jgi:hypothetical protein
MKQVSKDEFYAYIGPLDVIVDIRTNYPNSLYKMRNSREVVGKNVESADRVKAAIGEGKTYFIKG